MGNPKDSWRNPIDAGDLARVVLGIIADYYSQLHEGKPKTEIAISFDAVRREMTDIIEPGARIEFIEHIELSRRVVEEAVKWIREKIGIQLKCRVDGEEVIVYCEES